MLRTFLGIVLAVSLLAPDSPRPQGDDNTDDTTQALRVEVMSFNIRYGTARDGENHWRFRRQHCIDIIDRLGGDFVGLQEALQFQNEELRRGARHYGVIGVGRDDGINEGEHCTILYDRRRWVLDERNNGTFWLSDTPHVVGSRSWGNRIPRIVTWARFTERSTGNAVWVYNTHFDHRSEPARQSSAVAVAMAIARRADQNEPVIFMGDLNASENSTIVRYLTGRGTINERTSPVTLVETFRQVHPDETEVGTFNGFNFGRTRGPKIDFIFVDEAATVHDAQIIREHRDERYPSDHFPITATVSWDLGSSKSADAICENADTEKQSRTR